jgi:hypothetical protein
MSKQTAMKNFADKLLAASKQREQEGSPCATIWYLCHQWALQQLHEEKQQIVDAHLTGLIYPLEIEATKQAEQYYNETYGGAS